MAFKALNEVFDGRLRLPGKDGKIYYVPEPDGELGLWCTALFAAGVAVNFEGQLPEEGLPELQLDDKAENAMYLRILGADLMAELKADGYGHSTIGLFGQTAFFWIAAGRDLAEAYWNSGGDPKVSPPSRAARRTKPAPSVSTRSTAAASTTKRAGSTSGTKPPAARSRKRPAAG